MRSPRIAGEGLLRQVLACPVLVGRGFDGDGAIFIGNLDMDYWTEGGPFLWAFDQGGSGNVIVQYDIAAGAATGYTFDVSPYIVVGSGIAGGLFTHANVFGGTVTIGGNSQNDTYFGFELAASGGPAHRVSTGAPHSCDILLGRTPL